MTGQLALTMYQDFAAIGATPQLSSVDGTNWTIMVTKNPGVTTAQLNAVANKYGVNVAVIGALFS